jgi:hypothetical protein
MNLGKSNRIYAEMLVKSTTVIIAGDNQIQIFTTDSADKVIGIIDDMQGRDNFDKNRIDFDIEMDDMPELFIFWAKNIEIPRRFEGATFKLDGDVHLYWDPNSNYMSLDANEREWAEPQAIYETGNNSRILFNYENLER